MSCLVCSKQSTKHCGRCDAPYCSKECQTQDWPRHKVGCAKPGWKSAPINVAGFNVAIERPTKEKWNEIVGKMEKAEKDLNPAPQPNTEEPKPAPQPTSEEQEFLSYTEMLQKNVYSKFTPEELQETASKYGCGTGAVGTQKMRDTLLARVKKMTGLDPEMLMAQMAPQRYEQGKAKQRFMEESLVPFLKEHKASFTDPSTQGVIFIDGVIEKKPVSLSVMPLTVDPPTFDIFLSDPAKCTTENLTMKHLGYDPAKVLPSLEDLQAEILKLLP